MCIKYHQLNVAVSVAAFPFPILSGCCCFFLCCNAGHTMATGYKWLSNSFLLGASKSISFRIEIVLHCPGCKNLTEIFRGIQPEATHTHTHATQREDSCTYVYEGWWQLSCHKLCLQIVKQWKWKYMRTRINLHNPHTHSPHTHTHTLKKHSVASGQQVKPHSSSHTHTCKASCCCDMLLPACACKITWIKCARAAASAVVCCNSCPLLLSCVCECVLSIQSTCFNKALILPHTLTHTHTDADTHNKRLSAEVHSYKNVHLFSYHCACCRSCCCCCCSCCHCVRSSPFLPFSLCQFAYVCVLYTSTHTHLQFLQPLQLK